MPSSSVVKQENAASSLTANERGFKSTQAVDQPLQPPLQISTSAQTLQSPSADTLVVQSPDQTPSPLDDDGPEQTTSAGVHRTKARSTSNARDAASPLKAKPEKRKRNRVTPEQLVELEAAFAKDRSPTAAFRREMSTRLGMSERAVQIWFQNRYVKQRSLFSGHVVDMSATQSYRSRRAKAKHQDQKVVSPNTNNPNPVPLEHWPPEEPPALAAAQETDLAELLNERERAYISTTSSGS